MLQALIDRAAPVRSQRARWHERRVMWSANPGLGVLCEVSRVSPPIVRVPKLGWVVRDPKLIRQILIDHRSTSVLGEGGVGHLWAQILGDWVNDAFDGAGHHSLRTRARDLFTESKAAELVDGVATPLLADVTERLQSSGTVDVADTARVLVGRMVAEMLGVDIEPFRARAGALDHDGNGPYRVIFARGEEMASLAIGTQADTTLDPRTVERAREILGELTADVPAMYRSAPETTLLGRCRMLGVTEQEATGLTSLLLVAGTETAASAIGRTTALLADTGQAKRLCAASGGERTELLDTAVREGLRVTTPAPVIGRHVTRDVTVAGKTLRAGDRVVAVTYAANNRPGSFDLDRPYLPENRQLWFGAGRHLCLGAPVARAEIRSVLESLMAAGPWEIVSREASRRVLIPTYRHLVVRSST